MKNYYSLIIILISISCIESRPNHLTLEESDQHAIKNQMFYSNPLFLSIRVVDSLELNPIRGLSINLTEQASGIPLLVGKTDSLGYIEYQIDPMRYNLEKIIRLRISAQGFSYRYENFYEYKEELIDINGQDSLFLLLKLKEQ